MTAEVEALFAELDQEGVVVRGVYDVAGLRADADFMVWWHAEGIATVQSAYNRLRRTELGRHLTRSGPIAALHRPAEFNKGHIPAFMAGEEPEDVHLRLPVRALLRLVPAGRQGAARHAGGARARGPRLPRRPRQHRRLVRAGRLRVGAGVRGRRAAPHRRPHAELRGVEGADARARGGAVLHRAAVACRTWSPPCPDRDSPRSRAANRQERRPVGSSRWRGPGLSGEWGSGLSWRAGLDFLASQGWAGSSVSEIELMQ